jgi:hypothetical protein
MNAAVRNDDHDRADLERALALVSSCAPLPTEPYAMDVLPFDGPRRKPRSRYLDGRARYERRYGRVCVDCLRVFEWPRSARKRCIDCKARNDELARQRWEQRQGRSAGDP